MFLRRVGRCLWDSRKNHLGEDEETKEKEVVGLRLGRIIFICELPRQKWVYGP